MEIAVPVLEHLLGEVGGADQFREQPAGEREVAPVDLAQQVLARHRHVLRIGGAEEVVALVGARAALDAGIEEDAQAPVPAEQLAHLRDRRVVPVVDQLAGEAERLLVVGGGHERAAVGHRAFDDDRDLGKSGIRGVSKAALAISLPLPADRRSSREALRALTTASVQMRRAVPSNQTMAPRTIDRETCCSDREHCRGNRLGSVCLFLERSVPILRMIHHSRKPPCQAAQVRGFE